MSAVRLPDPAAELRATALRTVRGVNYWSTRPVTRLDLAVGAYDEISSADAPGATEALCATLPGLVEHHCSVGERGGFITRLRRGTYAPHIVEHVALELQCAIGHVVGYGRTRGGDAPGEYTVVLEHRHAGVGVRAATLALDIVRRAFAGRASAVAGALTELRAIAASPDVPRPGRHVWCAITGGAARAETVREVARRGLGALGAGVDVVDVAPARILEEGLPYARSELAIILDAEPVDVPPRYRERDRACRLVATLAHAVRRGGVVVLPAGERDVAAMAREAGCQVAWLATERAPAPGDLRGAWAVARVEGGRIVLERDGARVDGGALRGDTPPGAQAAAALACLALRARDTWPAVEAAADA
ncbi:MAG TPA: hypothetical protein VFS44_01140 [Gemmatimonadaceae bacterium]|nr:hypothetical protein [Gemmatimonadaceae bacterium]